MQSIQSGWTVRANKKRGGSIPPLFIAVEWAQVYITRSAVPTETKTRLIFIIVTTVKRNRK